MILTVLCVQELRLLCMLLAKCLRKNILNLFCYFSHWTISTDED